MYVDQGMTKLRVQPETACQTTPDYRKMVEVHTRAIRDPIIRPLRPIVVVPFRTLGTRTAHQVHGRASK